MSTRLTYGRWLVIFELLTGDLFDPKQGDDYSVMGICVMTELLGELPEPMRFDFGKYRAQFCNSRGELRNIKQLRCWDLLTYFESIDTPRRRPPRF